MLTVKQQEKHLSLSQERRRVFSAMQPTGLLHLGNYLGALHNWVGMQKTHDCLYCIADLHALTSSVRNLHSHTYYTAASFIAAGVQPGNSIIFRQSAVAEHSELAWILSCFTSLGRLNRMTQFKDKAGRAREDAHLGLYAYPVLMAADILLYQAHDVPTGEDQKQHIELVRDIADSFNHDHECDFFRQPCPYIVGHGTRIMSLRDGSVKMSKSDPSDQSRLNLTDHADQIAHKIRRAKTDPECLPYQVDDLNNRPEASNLLSIYAALSQESLQKVLERFGGWSFSAFKEQLAELVIATMAPISDDINRLLDDRAEIDRILADGAERARALAQETMKNLRALLQLSPSDSPPSLDALPSERGGD